MKLRTKFQDEDFELGEVVDADVATMPDGRIKLQAVAKAGGLHTIFYDKLEKLYEDWEDAPEEPKDDYIRVTESFIHYVEEADESFYCDETVQKFVEELKAWKRLKDCGFKFVGWKRDEQYSGDYHIEAEDYYKCDDKDLDLLFGGKE